MTEQPAAALLRWCGWRRWHQAWARYHHYRRRDGPEPHEADDAATVHVDGMIEEVWRRLQAQLPPTKRNGRPYVHDRRVVLEAIIYVMQTGCAWHTLPSSFPPWQTVYAQLTRWRRTGVWDMIWAGLHQPSFTV